MTYSMSLIFELGQMEKSDAERDLNLQTFTNLSAELSAPILTIMDVGFSRNSLGNFLEFCNLFEYWLHCKSDDVRALDSCICGCQFHAAHVSFIRYCHNEAET
jgi:hypothetical protein